jgi:hypothetical protein
VSSVSYGSENLFLYFEGTTHIKSTKDHAEATEAKCFQKEKWKTR